MVTGTDGPDVIFGGVDFIDGRGGDDVIYPDYDYPLVTVDGGTGFDTLSIDGWFLISANGYEGDLLQRSGLFGPSNDVSYSSIERLVIGGANMGSYQSFGDAEVELRTGYRHPFYTFPILHVQTGGGNDKIFFVEGATGSGAKTGSGNDLIDYSGFVGNDLTPPPYETYAYGEAGDDTIIGSRKADKLYGGEGRDFLSAGAGDDFLDGGAGPDRLEGGSGRDSYWVDTGDSVIENGDEGLDFVWARSSFVLTEGSHVELLGTADWRSSTALDLGGNALANQIVGNEGPNKLRGGGGDDVLRGLGGSDQLFGDNGADRLEGGDGSDRYWVDNGDTIVETAGDGALDYAWAQTSFTLTPGAHVECLGTADWRDTRDLDLGGNELANSITGNEGANILTGHGGRDVLRGLGGADVFRYLSAADSSRGSGADQLLDFTTGIDRIDLSLIDAIPGSNDDAFTFIGSAPFSGVAGQLRVESTGGRAHLLGDIDGDGLADLQIIVTNTDTIAASDFIL